MKIKLNPYILMGACATAIALFTPKDRTVVGVMYIKQCPMCESKSSIEGYECVIKGLESTSEYCTKCDYTLEK